MTITEMAVRLRERSVSSVELVDQALQHAAKDGSQLNAFITLTEESARKRAHELDQLRAAGTDLGLLHGVPIAHKDCLRTAGVKTTAGSKILAGYVPKADAEVVARLHAAGAVMIGKTGLHEFTYGISGVNPHYGPVRNPWDVERVSGGSSSGSGAAVAEGVVPIATGTDTGGSIRIPASFCGCVGLKPTYGRVSRAGAIALGPSQDHVGPMTKTTEDCAIAYRVMAGLGEPSDSDADGSDLPLKGVSVGMPIAYFWQMLDPEVERIASRAVALARELGAEVREVVLPEMEALMDAARVILSAEAASELGQYKSSLQDFGDDVRLLLEKGREIPAKAYLDAQRTRNRLKRQLASVWRDVDCLVTPTTPTTAFRIDQTEMMFGGQMQDVRAVTTRLTRPFNALGWPALSLPCGFTAAKMPVGLQLVGAAGDEETVLRVGMALEGGLALGD